MSAPPSRHGQVRGTRSWLHANLMNLRRSSWEKLSRAVQKYWMWGSVSISPTWYMVCAWREYKSGINGNVLVSPIISLGINYCSTTGHSCCEDINKYFTYQKPMVNCVIQHIIFFVVEAFIMSLGYNNLSSQFTMY